MRFLPRSRVIGFSTRSSIGSASSAMRLTNELFAPF
jgi:hypothetical protein